MSVANSATCLLTIRSRLKTVPEMNRAIVGATHYDATRRRDCARCKTAWRGTLEARQLLVGANVEQARALVLRSGSEDEPIRMELQKGTTVSHLDVF